MGLYFFLKEQVNSHQDTYHSDGEWYQLEYILRMTCAMADMLLSTVEP